MHYPFKSNSTFSAGHDIRYNACVGKNGYNDIEAYEIGYTNSVKILIDSLKKDPGYIDPIIYPLVFCARHSIELFLKKTVTEIEVIYAIINKKYQPKDLTRTHNLRDLLNYFIKLASFDLRLDNDVTDLKRLIEDYYDVDLTGESFRYPYNKQNLHHLDDFSCINLIIFEKQFNELSIIKDRLTSLVGFLNEEYAQNTIVGNINRETISDISRELIKKVFWSNLEFDVNRNQIKQKYNISSNQLSKIIKKIESHREFSRNIGVILPVKELSIDDYAYFKNKHQEYQNNVRKQKDFLEYKNSIARELSNFLTQSAVSSLRSFYEIGFHRLYSEEYDALINYYNSKESFNILFFELLDGGRIIERIQSGMFTCGQEQFQPKLKEEN